MINGFCYYYLKNMNIGWIFKFNKFNFKIFGGFFFFYIYCKDLI